jgi:arginine N-succinyltransferase
MLLRTIRSSDFDSIEYLAQNSGVGMTTLAKDKGLLNKRVQWSIDSYQKELTKPDHEYYLFVLEDLDTKKIIGISGIESQVGYAVPFYSYKISKRTRICKSLNIRNDYEVLNLVNDHQGTSEICSLFLAPEYRKNNNGLLLSKARFLFMAEHPQRFSSTVIAELRGVSDDQGNSPFWDHVGAHFFHMPFSRADQLTLATDKQFIADLMPRNPIYVQLLSQEAQAVIGMPHSSTVPAMNILLKEGFHYNKYIDIFDAGPTIEAPLNNIRTIAHSKVIQIKDIDEEINNADLLLSNNSIDFRATMGGALLNKQDNSCVISEEIANALQVNQGDYLRVAPVHTQTTLAFS